MKTKLLILILACYLQIINNVFSQFECSVMSFKSSGDIPDAAQYIPDANTPIKYLRVNIHFILKEPGTEGYPGNFTNSDDGNGNSNYTGYDYAFDLIDKANYRLSMNTQMKMPPGNSTDVLSRQYRYVINGIYFNEDNDYYTFSSSVPTEYSVNASETINIFLNHSDNGIGGGYANMTGNRYMVMKYSWEGYLLDPEGQLWVRAGTINHEIGHNLSLFHTMLTNGGICYNNEDYCTDTPSRNTIITQFGFDPCCGWGGGEQCTNNQMDYTGEDAITPLQLGRQHWTIENEMFRYKICYFTNNTINITSFSDNMAYVASNVTIPSGNSILVNDNKGMFINCENFEINGEFEITTGCILTINTKISCN